MLIMSWLYVVVFIIYANGDRLFLLDCLLMHRPFSELLCGRPLHSTLIFFLLVQLIEHSKGLAVQDVTRRVVDGVVRYDRGGAACDRMLAAVCVLLMLLRVNSDLI